MNATGLVEAVSAATSASAATIVVLRGWWSRRELRQQRAFRAAVQDIVDQSVADVLRRQADSERRQGQHLDRQDRKLDQLAAEVRRYHAGG